MEVRKFGEENKTPIPNPEIKGMQPVIVHLPGELAAKLSAEEIERRYKGKPLSTDTNNLIVVMYFDEYGEIHEHSAPENILFMVIKGSGYVRIGGTEGETKALTAGDAVMWPANELHKAWTEGQALQAVVVHLP